MQKLLLVILFFSIISFILTSGNVQKHKHHHHPHHKHHHHPGKFVKTTKCVNNCVQFVKRHYFTKCFQIFQLGKLVKHCLLKKKQHCAVNCRETKKCFRVFKKKDCGECKDCVVSTIKCIKGKKCQKECIWKNFENCYFKRLPPYLVKKCSKLFKDNKLKKCITNCTHIVTWKDCWRHCNKHEVVHHHSKCKRLLIKKRKKI